MFLTCRLSLKADEWGDKNRGSVLWFIRSFGKSIIHDYIPLVKLPVNHIVYRTGLILVCAGLVKLAISWVQTEPITYTDLEYRNTVKYQRLCIHYKRRYYIKDGLSLKIKKYIFICTS